MRICMIGSGRVEQFGFRVYLTLTLLLGLCGFLITFQAQTSASTTRSRANRLKINHDNERSFLPSAVASNGRIAFTRRRDQDNADVYTMNADGGNQVNLTNNASGNSGPAWSPDGTKIAFISTRGQFYRSGEIYVMNADGSNLTQLTHFGDATDTSILGPAWSPDGTKLVFINISYINSAGNILSQVILMNADGSGQEKLIYIFRGRPITHAPAWSPDGTRIAFASSGINTRDIPFTVESFIYIINADGSGTTKVADASGSNGRYSPLINGSPAWSPDGTKLAFVNNKDGNPEIYVMGGDGSNKRRLTNNTAEDGFPTWSPDGNTIAFTSNRDGALQIYAMNADGSNQARITNNTADSFDPNWQHLGTTGTLPPASATIQFSAPSYRIPENNVGGDTITVTRLGDLTKEVSVDYATADGTASQRSNYTTVSGTLSFAAGEASKTITVPVIDNAYVEGDKTVLLTLTNPKNAALGGAGAVALTITDNDTAPPSSNPIDDAKFFVRMQYLDFLNREPDQGGYNYWAAQILYGCTATDQKCINAQRVAVSAAFFIEQEFQDTGSFVYRFYKGSVGRQPKYAEFVSDRSRVIGGASLETSKQAFAEDWTQRTEFLQKYPATLAPNEFVDALLQTLKQTSGVDLTGQRQTYIDQLQAAGGTRGQVIRSVVENKAFQNAEYNRAFVLMQYFGYLKRDPDEGGYLFWLDVLNNKVPGNFRSMVCAFITSAEYQDRFSSIRTRNDQQCAP
ncbi:MAG: Calx-beta domain-containing protein [Pyrinomonadaceae bacterium]